MGPKLLSTNKRRRGEAIMTKKFFLDIHAIQTVPPSNINRDDTGTPKSAQYGGVRRARVSSQAWKRAIRDYFHTNGDINNVGVRTLNVADYVAKKIQTLDPTHELEDTIEMAAATLKNAGISLTKENKARALFFLGDTQANELAKAAIDEEKDKKKLKAILTKNPAVDIALFGRMVADDPSLNEDASAQVAHSISTHAVQSEFDFYTALDDLAPEDNAGAGMLGTMEFNSSTLYRYGNVAVHELSRQLNNVDSTVNTLSLFIEAFSNSLPTGKVNTFANQTLPQAILVSVRTDRPVNLVNAFEAPIHSNEGFTQSSIERLSKEYRRTQQFVKSPAFILTIGVDELGEKMASLEDLIQTFESKMKKLIMDE